MRLVYLFATLLALLAAFAPRSAGAAGRLNGAAPFVCVPTSVWDCGNDGDCERGTAQSENLPEFFTIDIGAKTLGAGETGRHSSIERISHSGDKTILYGADAARSWVAMINMQTGNLSATVTGDGESFVIYGVCLPQ